MSISQLSTTHNNNHLKAIKGTFGKRETVFQSSLADTEIWRTAIPLHNSDKYKLYQWHSLLESVFKTCTGGTDSISLLKLKVSENFKAESMTKNPTYYSYHTEMRDKRSDLKPCL